MRRQSDNSTRELWYKYVRLVACGRFQARPWDGRYRRHINLGCYDTERAAWDVCKRYAAFGELPPELLPSYVRTTITKVGDLPKGVRRFIAFIRFRLGDRSIHLKTDYHDHPLDAQNELLEMLRPYRLEYVASFNDPVRSMLLAERAAQAEEAASDAGEARAVVASELSLPQLPLPAHRTAPSSP